jgi:hypothetical protein
LSKINYKTLLVPTSKNFSELEIEFFTEENEEGFNPGDDGRAEADMFSTLQADALLLGLLYRFTDRQKIILLYQILRESGYNLNHEDCAKTLSITREHYMVLLSDVKKRARKIIQSE